MGKLGDKVKTFFKKDTTKKALRKFGDSMQNSAQNIASSIDSTTMAKGVTVKVNENDLRLQDTTENLLATKVGDDFAYAPYEEWSKSKKDIIT